MFETMWDDIKEKHQANWGRVICPEREELDRLSEKYRK